MGCVMRLWVGSCSVCPYFVLVAFQDTQNSQMSQLKAYPVLNNKETN